MSKRTAKTKVKGVGLKNREIHTGSIARVIASSMQPRRMYSIDEIYKEIYLPGYGLKSKSTVRIPLNDCLRNHYLERTGSKRGTRYCVNEACVKPRLTNSEAAMVGHLTGTKAQATEPTQAQVAKAADNLLNGKGIAPAPDARDKFQIKITETDPSKEPALNGVAQSSIWTGQKFVTDENGNRYVVITTKIRLA